MAHINEVKYIIRGEDRSRPSIESGKRGIRGYGRTARNVAAKVQMHWQAMQKAFKMATMVLVAGAALAGAALYKMALSTAAVGDHARKTAQGLGLTTEALQELAYAASIGGMAQAEIEKGLLKLVKTAKDADIGLMTYKRIYDDLGLSIRNANNEMKSTDVLLMEIADKFSAMENGTMKTAYALELFGKSGAKMIPMLNAGSAEIEKLMQYAHRLGIVLSDEDAKAAEEFNDRLGDLKFALTGLKNTIGVGLIPEFTRLSQGLTEFVIAHKKNFVTFAKDATGALLQIGKAGIYVTAGLMDSFNGLSMLWRTLWVEFLEFSEFVWEKLHAMREANIGFFEAINIGGIFDEQLAYSRRIAEEQRLVLAGIRGEIISTTRELENMVDKVLTEGLAIEKAHNFVKAFEDAMARVKASMTISPSMPDDGGGGDTGDATDGMTEAQKAFEQTALIEYYKWLAREEANALAAEQQRARLQQANYDQWRAAQEAIRIEKYVSKTKMTITQQTANNALGLLQVLGAQSKVAAMVGLVVQKGLAMAQTFISGKAAELRAMADLGPIAGPPMAAMIAGWTKVNMALIAATGLGQMASMGASPQAAGGTAGEPLPQAVNTGISAQEEAKAPTQVVNYHIYGNVVNLDELTKELIPSIKKWEHNGAH